MGNEAQSYKKSYDSNFQMQKYINRGLPPSEVLKVKEAFDAFSPVDGKIDS